MNVSGGHLLLSETQEGTQGSCLRVPSKEMSWVCGPQQFWYPELVLGSSTLEISGKSTLKMQAAFIGGNPVTVYKVISEPQNSL